MLCCRCTQPYYIIAVLCLLSAVSQGHLSGLVLVEEEEEVKEDVMAGGGGGGGVTA